MGYSNTASAVNIDSTIEVTGAATIGGAATVTGLITATGGVAGAVAGVLSSGINMISITSAADSNITLSKSIEFIKFNAWANVAKVNITAAPTNCIAIFRVDQCNQLGKVNFQASASLVKWDGTVDWWSANANGAYAVFFFPDAGTKGMVLSTSNSFNIAGISGTV